MPLRKRIAFTALLILMSAMAHAENPVRVYAASSLTDAFNDIAAQWQQAGNAKPILVLAGSATLAKQIEAGAPADVFVSADVAWMDYLDRRDRLGKSTRVSLMGNSLVLIAPRGRGFAVNMQKGFDFAGAFAGRLCTGEPDVVPAGTYAKQSLQFFGWWQAIESRLVGSDDVRTALAFVERGECAAGIVYATDAKSSRKVEIIGQFPDASHAPIVYSMALVKNSGAQAQAFWRFVQTSPKVAAILDRYGFMRFHK